MSTTTFSISLALFVSTILCGGLARIDQRGRLAVDSILPGSVYLKFFLYNVTNPDEFESGEEKPALEQVGPFVFRETTEKFNISHADDGSTVTFAERKYYEFFPEESADSEASINFINVPLMSFGSNLARVPVIGVNIFKSLIKAKETIIKRNIPIKDFFYGYDAGPYLKVIDILMPGEPLPPQFEGGTFGLLKDRNASEGGPYEVGTGDKEEYEYGQIVSWKGLTQLDWWPHPDGEDAPAGSPNYCNMINGSVEDSTNLDTVELQHYHLHVFLPDACRSLKYTYFEEAAFGGEDEPTSIVGLKYKFDPHMLETMEENPDNKCFCAWPGENNKNCLRKGTMDLGPCRQRAPLALTYPHFLDADPYYLEMVKSGLGPRREEHESFMIVEPKTGTILQDVKRMQLSVRLRPTPAFAYLKNLPDMLFPLLWTEKVYTLDGASVGNLLEELNDPKSGLTANLVESWRVRAEEEEVQKLRGKGQEGRSGSGSANEVSAQEEAQVHGGQHGGSTGGALAAKTTSSYIISFIVTAFTLTLTPTHFH